MLEQLLVTAAICVILYFLYNWLGKGAEKTERYLEEAKRNAGFDESIKIMLGNYLSGHPDVDAQVNNVALIPKPVSGFEMYDYGNIYKGAFATIPNGTITNVAVEDKTTVERRVTLGRFLVAGPLALLWRKKETSEAAYIIIEWHDGRHAHETVFQVTGKDAVQSANAARNALLRVL